MGCCGGKDKVKINVHRVYEEHGLVAKERLTFETLKLEEEDVGKLYQIFCNIDGDRSGQIDLKEMLVHLELERTKFTKRVFSIFDEDNSGEIDFREFVIALWNYCTLGKASLVMFAFDLYDNDSSGCIDILEVELMLKEVYGKNYDTNVQARLIFNKLLQVSEKQGSSEISIDQFRDFVRGHPALLYPAFMLQTSLQKKIMGLEFWEWHAEKRMEASHGRFVNINQLLQLHINEQAFKDLVEGCNIKKTAANDHVVDALLSTGTVGARRKSLQAKGRYHEVPLKKKQKQEERARRKAAKEREAKRERERQKQKSGSSSTTDRTGGARKSPRGPGRRTPKANGNSGGNSFAAGSGYSSSSSTEQSKKRGSGEKRGSGDSDSKRSGDDSTKRSGDDSTRRSGDDSTRRSGDDSTRRSGGGSTRRSGGDTRRSGGDTRRSGGDTRHSGGDTRHSGGDARRSSKIHPRLAPESAVPSVSVVPRDEQRAKLESIRSQRDSMRRPSGFVPDDGDTAPTGVRTEDEMAIHAAARAAERFQNSL